MNNDVFNPAGVALFKLDAENTGRISEFYVQVFDPNKVRLKLCDMNSICDGAVIIVKRGPHRENRSRFSHHAGLLTAHGLIVREQIVCKDTHDRNVRIVGHAELDYLAD